MLILYANFSIQLGPNQKFNLQKHTAEKEAVILRLLSKEDSTVEWLKASSVLLMFFKFSSFLTKIKF